jgi:TonB family protein
MDVSRHGNPFDPRRARRTRAARVFFALAAMAGGATAAHAAYVEPMDVPPGELRAYWRLDTSSWMDAIDRNEVLELGVGCAAVAFDIDQDGTTSHVRVVRSRPGDRHHDAVVRIIKALRFVAAQPDEPLPVRTRYVVTFGTGRERTLGTRISAGVTVDDRSSRVCTPRQESGR